MQRSASILILRIHTRTFGDKEFSDFRVTVDSRMIQRSQFNAILRIHIRTFSKKQFDNFLLTPNNCNMQRSPSVFTLRIHIPTSIQVLFDRLDVSVMGSLVNIHAWPTPHPQQGYDDCDQL